MAKSGAVKLREWCKRQEINFSEGARRIGTVPDTFRRYALGLRLPRPPHMVSIYHLTGIEPNDWYDLEQPLEEAAA